MAFSSFTGDYARFVAKAYRAGVPPERQGPFGCELERALVSNLPVPFQSSVMTVEPAWIDYNGHLNMAYYNVLFDRALDQASDLLGLGPTYLRSHECSTFTAEA